MPMISASYGSNFNDDDSESQALLHKNSLHVDRSYSRKTTKFSGNGLWIKFAIIILSMFATLLVITWAIDALPNEPSIHAAISSPDAARTPNDIGCLTSADVHLLASNEYGVYQAPYPWLLNSNSTDLVEPFKSTTLSLLGVPQQACSGLEYLWRINYLNGSSLYFAHTSSPQLTLTLSTVGVFAIEIISGKLQDFPSSLSSQSHARLVYNGTIVSKYVKRELRELTIADREAFLNAAATLWNTDTFTGRVQYGSKYTSMATFVEEHALASNNIRCDAYHEGTGFITHHLALQNSFDASIRAVDPSVITPYWDFTIEGQMIVDAQKSPSHLLKVSPFYSSEWFGSTDNLDHIVTSRWAHKSMPRTSASSVVNPNSFGFVRSYWNNNPDPEITRRLFDVCGVEPIYKTVPACSDHYSVMQSSTLGIFQMTSPGYGHGPLHVNSGGIGGDCVQGYQDFLAKWHDVLTADISDAEISAKGMDIGRVREYGTIAPRKSMIDRVVMGEYFHIYRSLWRSHMCARDNTPQLLRCPASCALNMTTAECKCEVPGLLDNSTDWKNVWTCVVNTEHRGMFEAFFSEEFLRDLVIFVSTTSIIEGEMLEAASPADILFWMIHPAIERLLSAKRLPDVSIMGDVNDISKWGPEQEVWTDFSYYTQAAGQNLAYPEAYVCQGHAASDRVLPDGLPLIEGVSALADSNQDGIVSNWEFYRAIDPNNMHGLDYVFSNFEWNHCSDGKIKIRNHFATESFMR